MIVLADKQAWQIPQCRHIESFKDLSLVRSTIPVHGDADASIVQILMGQCQPCSNGNLSSHNALPSIKVALLAVHVHGASFTLGCPRVLPHELSNHTVHSPTAGQIKCVVSVRCDDRIILGDASLHTNGNRLLTIVQMTEPTNLLRFVQHIRCNLHAPHSVHVGEKCYKFVLRRGHRRRWTVTFVRLKWIYLHGQFLRSSTGHESL
mmetsp:Transcript_230/g.496  ORF Transcript_230/g.496 Transcript_230/m.496 type:complete len:206 (+) Transcript_230:860-1477(+)